MEKSINDWVATIKSDRGQSIQEVVWDLILQGSGKNVFLNIISGLEPYHPDLAMFFAREVIRQTFKEI